MATTREVLARSTAMMRRVPHYSSGSVCRTCLGPVSNYDLCYACNELFSSQGVPASLQEAVVPMTAALSPSQWYTWLSTYKGYHAERGDVIASLAHEYRATHTTSISALLGGSPTHTTIVPSKRGYTFSGQPFKRALCRVQPIADVLVETARLKAGETVGRREYQPDVFDVLANMNGARVLILEDTWVTGATALSCAGSLLLAGASRVVVLPLARMVEESHWPVDHPYLVAMRESFDPYDASVWPR